MKRGPCHYRTLSIVFEPRHQSHPLSNANGILDWTPSATHQTSALEPSGYECASDTDRAFRVSPSAGALLFSFTRKRRGVGTVDAQFELDALRAHAPQRDRSGRLRDRHAALHVHVQSGEQVPRSLRSRELDGGGTNWGRFLYRVFRERTTTTTRERPRVKAHTAHTQSTLVRVRSFSY